MRLPSSRAITNAPNKKRPRFFRPGPCSSLGSPPTPPAWLGNQIDSYYLESTFVLYEELGSLLLLHTGFIMSYLSSPLTSEEPDLGKNQVHNSACMSFIAVPPFLMPGRSLFPSSSYFHNSRKGRISQVAAGGVKAGRPRRRAEDTRHFVLFQMNTADCAGCFYCLQVLS